MAANNETRDHLNKLLIIFKRTSSFLSPEEISNLFLLNHYFHSHLQVLEVQSQLIFDYLTFLTNIQTTSENFIEVFQRFSGIEATSLSEILQILTGVKNLIKNPIGEQGFDHWEVIDGGHGWEIENFYLYRNMKKVFASSYEWGSLQQKIDLRGLIRSDLKSTLIVGSPVCRRFDCESQALLKINILAGNNSREVTQDIDLEDFIESDPWKLLMCRVELNADDEFAVVEFKGKDKKWWAGNYGARFGYCFAYILHY